MTPEVLKAKLEKLGNRQRGILRSLCSHGSYPGQWTYGGHQTTLKLIDSVAKHGLITETQEPYPSNPNVTRSIYRATELIRNLHRWETAVRAQARNREHQLNSERMAAKEHAEGTIYTALLRQVTAAFEKLAETIVSDDRTGVVYHADYALRDLDLAKTNLENALEVIRKSSSSDEG